MRASLHAKFAVQGPACYIAGSPFNAPMPKEGHPKCGKLQVEVR